MRLATRHISRVSATSTNLGVMARGTPGRWIERVLVVVFGCAWLWSAAVELGYAAAPPLRLGLYDLFGFAAILGWSAGNLWCWWQRRGAARRRRFFLLSLGPPGMLALLARAVPLEVGQSGEYLALLASGVFVVLFLVPITFARAAPEPR